MSKPAKGFVLVTPSGDILVETFRSSRGGSRQWLLSQKEDGRYVPWNTFYRKGWRCYPAEMSVILQAPKEEA